MPIYLGIFVHRVNIFKCKSISKGPPQQSLSTTFIRYHSNKRAEFHNGTTNQDVSHVHHHPTGSPHQHRQVGQSLSEGARGCQKHTQGLWQGAQDPSCCAELPHRGRFQGCRWGSEGHRRRRAASRCRSQPLEPHDLGLRAPGWLAHRPQPRRDPRHEHPWPPRFTGHKLADEGYVFKASDDQSAKNVYDQFKQTYDFYNEVLGRDSINGRGQKLIGAVHYDEDSQPGFFNAFFFDEVMAYGDGDGEIFRSFTDIIDITAHELTHGVTEATAQLVYENQAGALNESLSDVFGSLVKQYSKDPKQDARSADWLIGRGLFLVPDARALRDMANPGTAHGNTPITGRDRQPRDMDGYKELFPPRDDPETGNDSGGVHLYSGIPNRAFFLVATTLGGYAWEKAGKIWYNTMLDPEIRTVNPRTAFKKFADLTVKHAGDFGPDAVAAVKDAWTAVKVYPWNPVWMPAGQRDEL